MHNERCSMVLPEQLMGWHLTSWCLWYSIEKVQKGTKSREVSSKLTEPHMQKHWVRNRRKGTSGDHTTGNAAGGEEGAGGGHGGSIMQASRGVHSAMEISCSEVLLQNRITSTDPSGSSWLYRNEESNPKWGQAFRMVWGGLELWFTSSQVSGKVICRIVLWTFEWEFSNLTTSPYAPPPPTNTHTHTHTHRCIIRWAKSLFMFFYKKFWKNMNELYGQPQYFFKSQHILRETVAVAIY